MSRAIWAITGKELRELLRDPLSLGLSLVLPLVLLFLLTYGLDLDVERVRLGVYDLNRSASSRDYLASLSANGDIVVLGEAADVEELGEWLDAGRIGIGLIVPPDFERTLLARQPARVQLLVDGSKPTRAKAALAQVDAAASFHTDRLAHELGLTPVSTGPRVVPEARVWFNPGLQSVNYIVPGLFSLILMVFSPMLSTLAIAREREMGSIQQILAAPVSPAAVVLGKAIPYGLLAFLDLLAILVVGLAWFRVPFRGSLLLFLAVGAIFVFCVVGIGLLISTVTRSQVAAMVLAFVVTFMPAFNFSGFMTPTYSLPTESQWFARVFPASYFTDFARGLTLKGYGLPQLWPQVAALVAFAVAVLLLATCRFGRRIE